MEVQEILDKVDEMYVFYLNSEWCTKNCLEFEKMEKECQNVLDAIKKLKIDRDYYFNKLHDVADIVIGDMHNPLAKQIVEVLDAD